jgi:hypothetical protein
MELLVAAAAVANMLRVRGSDMDRLIPPLELIKSRTYRSPQSADQGHRAGLGAEAYEVAARRASLAASGVVCDLAGQAASGRRGADEPIP